MPDTTTISAKTFPGFYSTIVDRSFLLPQTSRFSCGLVGVARKGPFDTPTPAVSLQDFIRQFGQPLAGDFFLANAVAMLSGLTDGVKIVRVGKQSTVNNGATAITTQLSNTGTVLPFSKALLMLPSIQNQGGVGTTPIFVSFAQTGKTSSVNMQIVSVGTLTGGYTDPVTGAHSDAGTVTFNSANAIQDTYTGAAVSYSVGAPAANSAESILYAYTYGTNGDQNDAGLYSGSFQALATGNKGDFQFTVAPVSMWASFTPGQLLKIKQPGKATTHEVKVRQSLPDGTVYLETTDRQSIGYQALPLQDSYSGATIHSQTGRMPYLYLAAASAGDWANSGDITSGLFVKVRPGGAPGTKKFEVYENGALQETIDALYNGSGTNSYAGRINAFSQEIDVNAVAGTISDMQPANYSFGFAAGAALINAGVGNSGGSFNFGYNGEGAIATDFIGQYNPSTDRLTGMQSFIDTDNVRIDILACPGITDAAVGGGNDFSPFTGVAEPFPSTDTTSVHQKMVNVARLLNAVAIIDVPPGLNLRQAVDWHNGQGLFTGRGRMDTFSGAVFWNWFLISDPFTGQDKWVPPTYGALRCLAFTFDRDKPWYAAAGDIRGLIPEAKQLEYEHVSDDSKQASYGVGTGQSVNGIYKLNGQIKLYGERTLQVAESKLSVVHNVVLVNYVVTNLAIIGRRFVFEPNDAELLTRLKLAFTQLLDQVKNERGLEDYLLVIDNSNNNAETRNKREVIVGLELVPIDTVERIFLTATVNSSGATLTAASAQ